MTTFDWIGVIYCIGVLFYCIRTMFDGPPPIGKLSYDRTIFIFRDSAQDLSNITAPGMLRLDDMPRAVAVRMTLFDNDPVWFQYEMNRWAYENHQVFSTEWTFRFSRIHR